MRSRLVSECVDRLVALQKNAELVGDQEEIDANGNGKIEEDDFEILRNKKDTQGTETSKEEDTAEKEAAYDPGLWWEKVGYESPSPAEKTQSTLSGAAQQKKKEDGTVDYGKHPNLKRMQGSYATMAAGPPATVDKKAKPSGPIGELLLAKITARGKAKK